MNTPCGPVELVSRAADPGAWDWWAFGGGVLTGGIGLLILAVVLMVALDESPGP